MPEEQPQEESDSPDQEGPGQASDMPGWQFKAEERLGSSGNFGQDNFSDPIKPVEWTASEYIAHHKTPRWFVLLGLATGAAMILVYLITRDKVSSGVVAMVGIIFGVMAARPPHVLNYSVSESGIQIGPKFYSYGEFKSFSVIDEGAISSISLLPLKRFMSLINIYYDPKDEEKIVSVLAAALPVEHRQQDAVEKLMRRVRF